MGSQRHTPTALPIVKKPAPILGFETATTSCHSTYPFFWKDPIFREAQLKASAVERNVRSPRHVPFRHRAAAEVYLHLFLTSALERWLVNA